MLRAITLSVTCLIIWQTATNVFVNLNIIFEKRQLQAKFEYNIIVILSTTPSQSSRYLFNNCRQYWQNIYMLAVCLVILVIFLLNWSYISSFWVNREIEIFTTFSLKILVIKEETKSALSLSFLNGMQLDRYVTRYYKIQ